MLQDVFCRFPSQTWCFRHKSQVAETWVLSFQDIFNGINLKPCSMVVESLIYMSKSLGAQFKPWNVVPFFVQDLTNLQPKLSQSARYQTPAAVSNPLHPLHANVGFSAAFSVASKVEVAMPHSFPTKTQPLDPQNPWNKWRFQSLKNMG